MRLTVIGCSGSGPGPDGPASCYLVEQDGFRLVLDLGNGSLGVLSRYADVRTVDALVLSHLHADHCLDACSLVVAHRYHPGGAAAPIPLHGPAGTHDRLRAARDPGAPGGLGDVFDFTDLTAGEREIGPFSVRFARVNHPVETYAMRISADGHTLTYSGDTGLSPALVELARGSDLLLCESSFVEPTGAEPANPPDLHLTGRQAAEHAAAAGVGRLLLTHIPMWTDRERVLAEAVGVFPSAELVRSGSTYEL
ncbi:MBL fold metallo-hydrolase [soil metagenome]